MLRFALFTASIFPLAASKGLLVAVGALTVTLMVGSFVLPIVSFLLQPANKMEATIRTMVYCFILMMIMLSLKIEGMLGCNYIHKLFVSIPIVFGNTVFLIAIIRLLFQVLEQSDSSVFVVILPIVALLIL